MRTAEVLQRIHALFAVFVGSVRRGLVFVMLVVMLMAAVAGILVVMMMLMATAAGVLVVMVVLMAAVAGILAVMVLMATAAGVLVVVVMLMTTAARCRVGMHCHIFGIFCMHVGMRSAFARGCSRAGFFECHDDGLLIYI